MINLNAIELAYIGDAWFELQVRNWLIERGIRKVNNLQSEAKNYSSAIGQAKLLNKISDLLTEEEIAIIKNAKNYKRNVHPKNTSLATYKASTAFEALLGYLYLKNDFERLKLLMNEIFK